MRAKYILNADMATVNRWMAEAFRWWLAEVSELLPRGWRKSFLRGAPAIADVDGDSVAVRGADEGAAPPKSALIVLPPHAVLTREMDLPILPVADARRMIALDIDRLTPFRADAAVFDIELGERNAETGRQAATLAVVPRAAIEDAISRARLQGIEPAALAVDGEAGPRFDFLPSIGLGAAGAKRAQMWWWGAGALAAINLVFLIYRDEAELDSLREAVESQQTVAAVADRLRRKVDGEALRRAALMERARKTPLETLAAVSAALPDSAWVQRLEWNGQRVHLAGYQKDAANLIRAVENSPRLRNARALTAQAASQSGVRTFDLAADVEAAKPAPPGEAEEDGADAEDTSQEEDSE